MARWYEEQLKTPIRGGAVGMTGAESAAKYGLARRQIQGATKTAMEQTKSAMGGKGFRAGESGIADTAMASRKNRCTETTASCSELTETNWCRTDRRWFRTGRSASCCSQSFC